MPRRAEAVVNTARSKIRQWTASCAYFVNLVSLCAADRAASCEFVAEPFDTVISRVYPYQFYPHRFYLVLFGVFFTIFFETTVLVFTWIKTLGSQRILWANDIKVSLYTVLIRDGALYSDSTGVRR